MLSLLRSGSGILRQNVRPLRFYSNNIAPKDATKVPQLTWNQFFTLRQRRRQVSTACSIATSLLGLGVGWTVISNVEIDMTQKLFELEVVWFYGLGVVMCGFLGYLAGPTIGNVIFRATLGKNLPTFIEKDVEFLRRIRANRPDATKSNYSNQLTDYYGEKIGSLQGYRRWLREANLFTRRSQRFL